MPDGRPRLVFAACRPPFPLENGARIRTFQLLTGLARSFDVVFVTFERHPDSPEGWRAEQLAERLPQLTTITVPLLPRSKRKAQAGSLRRRSSWTLGRYRSSLFAEALQRAVASHRPCIVHLDDLGVAPYAPFPGTLSVYSAHNVEQAILRHEAQHGSRMRRLFNTVEARKVAREERGVWQRADICLAVSPLDAELMKAGGARHVELCPNGAEPVERLPLGRPDAGEPLRLLFVGSGNYAPYERGLAWLVRDVLPRVRANVPVAFDVVGTPPARPLSGEGVRYLGRVDSVREHYAAAHVVVVPVFEGSGTRLKILEAAAHGRPVVSTSLGAEGLPLRAGAHYLVADTAEEFAGALLELHRLRCEPAGGELERLVAGARAAVEPLLWPRIVAELADLYRAQIGPARGAPAPVAPPAVVGAAARTPGWSG
jgi:glycosyltransferase involved in cell wall biosynthesis